MIALLLGLLITSQSNPGTPAPRGYNLSIAGYNGSRHKTSNFNTLCAGGPGPAHLFQLGANSIVGHALIDMYCGNGETKIAQLVFKQMRIKDVSSWTSLLNGFVMCNVLESARRVFDEMPLRNGVAWTAMITGYVRGGMPIRGLQMFKQMKAEGENQPTVITAVAVLPGCADLGAHDHGQAVHDYISKLNLLL
ncbi:hypothetical protein SADUNF_Sadunf17G0138000 [Salix dunnii]|uniref:Pentatricopeptide repeat protein n=1 Tax=Salix dunnii TaxID=1413687 RepID=A0A835MHV2_9ROSI|nr:hypothetical protein SADUNF_Sadunf17G0138000 [Salix dunnii]